MMETGSLLGGEGNGGVILKESHLGRDSLTGVTLVLNRMSQSEKPLSKIFRSLPQFSIIKDKIRFEGGEISSLEDKLKKQFYDSRINESDGIKFTWDDSWIHFRKSNTEPILRIYAEAKNEFYIVIIYYVYFCNETRFNNPVCRSVVAYCVSFYIYY